MAYSSRQSSYMVAAFGGFLQVFAGWWDVFSHLLYGSVDPWWNPAHLTFYSAVAITLVGVWRGLRAYPSQPTAMAGPIRFVNLAGLKLAAVGCVIEIVAGAWNEIVHHLIRSEPRIAPAHALLVVGMLTVNFGVIIGLAIENGIIRHELIIASTMRRTAVVFMTLLTFSAIWLAASGSMMYLAGAFQSSVLNWVFAFMLSFFAALVLVPLKRVLPQFGSVIAVSMLFNCVAYLLLVVYAGSPSYVPWGLLSIGLFELLFWALHPRMAVNRALLSSSLVIGVFFCAAYYPFTLYLFPWSFSLQPSILSSTLGCVVGALLGGRVYTNLSSAVLGSVTASL